MRYTVFVRKFASPSARLCYNRNPSRRERSVSTARSSERVLVFGRSPGNSFRINTYAKTGGRGYTAFSKIRFSSQSQPRLCPKTKRPTDIGPPSVKLFAIS
jgi:hypothetical protein